VGQANLEKQWLDHTLGSTMVAETAADATKRVRSSVLESVLGAQNGVPQEDGGTSETAEPVSRLQQWLRDQRRGQVIVLEIAAKPRLFSPRRGLG